jgi:hypothetical protein
MEWLKIKFELEMELIRDENPEFSLHEQLVLAGSRVNEIATRYIGRIQEQKWAEHQEAVNLAHYS